MFQDEAGFGRINKPKRCWCSKKTRPSVPCHHIREYRYAYGAVDPTTGDHFFLVLPRCDTICMNVFLEELSKAYPEDQIILVCDGASWHRSKGLKVPDNITLQRIPPYTPEMNPIEQIWKQLRSMGFRNEVFKTLNHVVDRLCASLFDDLPFPVVIRLQRYAVFPAPGFHSDPTAAAGRMFQSLHSCSHSVSLRFLRILGNSRESFGHIISLLSGTTRGVVY